MWYWTTFPIFLSVIWQDWNKLSLYCSHFTAIWISPNSSITTNIVAINLQIVLGILISIEYVPGILYMKNISKILQQTIYHIFKFRSYNCYIMRSIQLPVTFCAFLSEPIKPKLITLEFLTLWHNKNWDAQKWHEIVFNTLQFLNYLLNEELVVTDLFPSEDSLLHIK